MDDNKCESVGAVVVIPPLPVTKKRRRGLRLEWDPEEEERDAEARRQRKKRRPQLAAPVGDYAVVEDDCVGGSVRVVRRWIDRTRAQTDAVWGDGGAWWDRAARALWPSPERAGALLLVSAILRGHPFSTPYDVLVAGVPQCVLNAVAWRGSRLIVGLCVHPDGCGPVASRPAGSPVDPHADRILRVAMRLAPPDLDGGNDGDDAVFTVGQVIEVIAGVCAGRVTGRRLQIVQRKIKQWYVEHTRWVDADGPPRESIQCFTERRFLLTERTGCTADALAAGLLRPCDWLAGAHGPTLDSIARSPRPARPSKDKEKVSDQEKECTHDDDNGDHTPDDHVDGGGDGSDLKISFDTDKRDLGGGKRAQVDGVDDNHDNNDNDDHIKKKRARQQRLRDAPSLRCVYERIVCRKAPVGGRASCVYVQSRLCAAEDRPDA
ncbi:hypothetical protein TW95_gp1747 [Pandoravirus inopinatum]|uniref:Uncharacterized protein n=1 Tax=Pandoravirus inopinatum TaxID=1605721 RepID=A0A0B5JBS1_9VIRU|nr:hypothetical protein TW95_gp1747 [Pandoravirus inopinatum]AJF98481.1 hypothetical protein [Pandoravirus inopinatum]